MKNYETCPVCDVVHPSDPMRMEFPGAATMVRFDENDMAIGVTRDLLEKIAEAAYAAVEAEYRRGLVNGSGAAKRTAAVRGGAL